ncbi:MAG: class I SAM-dependent methyltransferase [Candidatus Altiarchaeota archaeon]|nr:class I SAM-dependent methyltransferase [Candidatus Altiarchaeota archaeon]
MNFDEIAKSYDSWYGTPIGSYADRLEKKLIFIFTEPKKKKKVLDIGCGTGSYVLEFKRNGMGVVGMDVSRKMLKIAKNKVEGCDFVFGDAKNLPFKDNSFDLVTLITILEYVDDPEKIIQEGKRVLEKDGKIILCVLNKFSLWALQRRVTERDWMGVRFFSPFELKKRFGVKRWKSTLFAPKFTPPFLLRYLENFEGILSRIFKPFGAFIVAEIRK